MAATLAGKGLDLTQVVVGLHVEEKFFRAVDGGGFATFALILSGVGFDAVVGFAAGDTKSDVVVLADGGEDLVGVFLRELCYLLFFCHFIARARTEGFFCLSLR